MSRGTGPLTIGLLFLIALTSALFLNQDFEKATDHITGMATSGSCTDNSGGGACDIVAVTCTASGGSPTSYCFNPAESWPNWLGRYRCNATGSCAWSPCNCKDLGTNYECKAGDNKCSLISGATTTTVPSLRYTCLGGNQRIGDVNNDGKIDSKDLDILTAVWNSTISIGSQNICCGDTDNDGIIGMYDVLDLSNFIMYQPNGFVRGYSCSQKENCNDGIDNDDDGKIDASDTDCIATTTTTTTSTTTTTVSNNVLPDLTVESIWNKGGIIFYSIRNIGGAVTGTVYNGSCSKLYVDGIVVSSHYLYPFGAGETRTGNFSYYKWACSGTSDTIMVHADCDNSIRESNENNNDLTLTWPCPVVTTTTTTITKYCTDSDGGLNYYVKGTTYGPYVNNIDSCYQDGIGLQEQYCTSGGQQAAAYYNCPYGCSNGACISSKPDLVVNDIYYEVDSYIKVKYCNDGINGSTSDFLIKIRNENNGKEYPGNYYYRFKVPAPGECNITGGYTCGLINVSCGQKVTVSAIIDWEQRVNESNENNNMLTKTIGTESCNDSDGGLNYYVKGYVTVNGINSWDECTPSGTSANTLLEYYCTGDPNQPGLGILYTCPYGCSNGACISPKPDLTITDVKWTPITPKPGDLVRINVTLINIGTGTSAPTTVTAVDQNGWGNTAVMISLSPGQIGIAIVALSAQDIHTTYNPHNFIVRVDPSNAIDELKEDNNQKSFSMTVSSKVYTCLGWNQRIGDVNNDGKIDSKDLDILTAVWNSTISIGSQNICCGDTDNDGIIGMYDVLDLSNFIMYQPNGFVRGYSCSQKENCNDGIDNDDDGKIDASDTDCEIILILPDPYGSFSGGILVYGSTAMPSDYDYCVNKLKDYVSITKKDTEITQADKATKNLILIGTPFINTLTLDLARAGMTATEAEWMDVISKQYPYYIVQIVKDAYATGKNVLIIAGDSSTTTANACDYVLAGGPTNYPAKCTDSDGGKEYYMKGTTTGYDEPTGKLVTVTDYCQYDTIKEYYCDGKYGRELEFKCPYGCYNGACVKCPYKIVTAFDKAVYYVGEQGYFETRIYDNAGFMMPNYTFYGDAYVNGKYYNRNSYITPSDGIYKSKGTIDQSLLGEAKFVTFVNVSGCNYISDTDYFTVKPATTTMDSKCIGFQYFEFETHKLSKNTYEITILNGNNDIKITYLIVNQQSLSISPQNIPAQTIANIKGTGFSTTKNVGDQFSYEVTIKFDTPNIEGKVDTAICHGIIVGTEASTTTPIKELTASDLMEISMKLEAMKVSFNRMKEVSDIIARYYEGVGNTQQKEKFERVSEMFSIGIGKIDSLESLISENIDNIDPVREEINHGLDELRAYLNEILLEIVS